MKYFIYCRKSSEEKSRQIQSIDDQKRELTLLAKQKGLEVVDIIIDEKSAKKPGRKGFTKMIEQLQAGEVTGILCWKLDRLARNPVDGGSITWLLQEGKIEEIVTPDKTFYPNDNVLLIGIEFGMANQYIRDLSKNVKRGMKSKVEKGWLPTRAPLGYLNEVGAEKGTKRILPDPDTFTVVKSLWKRLLKDKLKFAELYRVMESEFPIFRKSSILASSSFYKIFHNPFYAGLFKWGGEIHIGSHKPMITLKEFEEAQEILKEEVQIRHTDLQFDLKGIFRCGVCNAQITAERHTKFNKESQQEKSYDYYKCTRRKKCIKCTEPTVSKKILENQILEFIEEVNIPDEIIEFGLSELEIMRKSDVEPVKDKAIKKEIEHIDRQLKNAMNLLLNEDDQILQKMTKDKILELKLSRKRLAEELELAIQERKDPYADIRNSLELIKGAKYTFLNGSKELKRKVVRGLGSNWTLKAKKLYFKPYFTISALQSTKELLEGGNFRFELNKPQDINKKLPSEAVSFVWSG